MSATPLPAEIRLLEQLAGRFAHSPLQCNARHEADAELVRLPGTATVLALTTDAISEEIEAGLYADPELIGWMTVLVNASDLAAVGAAPLGILLNQTLPPDLTEEARAGLQRGIGAASMATALPVLGGDTNFGPHLHMAATAAGIIADGRLLTRRGAAPGETLFASGPLGLGAAFALAHLMHPGDGHYPFRPRPRLAEGQLLRRYATCCMDTSDGAITTLDELSRLNGVGFALDPAAEILHPHAAAVARAAGLSPWLTLAGPHGEFELLFTVPLLLVQTFRDAATLLGWEPVEIGRVIEEPELRVGLGADGVRLDSRAIRDAYAESGADIERYCRRLVELMGAVSGKRGGRYPCRLTA